MKSSVADCFNGCNVVHLTDALRQLELNQNPLSNRLTIVDLPDFVLPDINNQGKITC
jgi:hypothetical protein